jgi:hypothetical protein
MRIIAVDSRTYDSIMDNKGTYSVGRYLDTLETNELHSREFYPKRSQKKYLRVSDTFYDKISALSNQYQIPLYAVVQILVDDYGRDKRVVNY